MLFKTIKHAKCFLLRVRDCKVKKIFLNNRSLFCYSTLNIIVLSGRKEKNRKFTPMTQLEIPILKCIMLT